ncbi:MAG: carbamate kinase [Theionarchaea archaeon]|nr:carbamate kinase [Theionarchaea archaeon]MBU7039100.1 carbamate kinase [Theionarchaea archaeon]
MRMVIALGGNAIKKPKEKGTASEQLGNVQETCQHIWELVRDHQVVITHGNGPQVGNILIQQEASEPYVPGMPLDICVAESQGLIGYMIQQSLRNVLQVHGVNKEVVTIISQVVVSREDPAFKTPTKPVGPFFSQERAEELRKGGISVVEDAGRGYRRVVPSPNPLRLIEAPMVASLLDQGKVVVAAGGGGIPVEEKKALCGVEAVIDKDLASEIVAEAIEADYLIILTDVDQVALNYNKETQENLDILTDCEAENYLEQGQFAPGSMGPKILSAIRFLRGGGKKAIITSPRRVREALLGEGGTQIVPHSGSQ